MSIDAPVTPEQIADGLLKTIKDILGDKSIHSEQHRDMIAIGEIVEVMTDNHEDMLQLELLQALAGLIDLITSGRHYRTQNPYTRPEVKAGLIAYGKATGQLPADFDPAGWMRDGSKHWMDVEYPQQEAE